jgi:UDP-N-acetylglucosamine acyltransferase
MIHKTAVIDAAATLGENVSVGPYSVIDADVVIGAGCTIGPHVQITGHTEIGRQCQIHKGAVIGDAPQDISYDGFVSYTKVGDHSVLREYVTVHRGSTPEAATVIGEHCMLMAFSHVAHDCQIGDHVIIANQSQIAGHVEIADRAIISGGVFVHQFCRIGTMCMIGGAAKITQDVPPFCLVNHDGKIVSLNAIGLKRNGVSSEERRKIREAFKEILFGQKPRSQAVKDMAVKYQDAAFFDMFVTFVQASKRGIQATVSRT